MARIIPSKSARLKNLLPLPQSVTPAAASGDRGTGTMSVLDRFPHSTAELRRVRAVQFGVLSPDEIVSYHHPPLPAPYGLILLSSRCATLSVRRGSEQRKPAQGASAFSVYLCSNQSDERCSGRPLKDVGGVPAPPIREPVFSEALQIAARDAPCVF